MIGEILGNRYELQEKIGEGGMSIVYKARCNKLHRYVAVKILKKELAENEEVIKKFKIEATAIATLSDNNIVNVLDVGTQGDINYIVMEYVKGKTLKYVIKQFGKLNYETTISMAIQIAKALECAHKNSIIHRDVKPQNILVTEEGLIKVTDFGIAKSTTSSKLTNTTTIMGSAHYFSPEQAKGSTVDARTDIYSLGVVLYEMVTGKLPFEAESPVTIALKHIQEEPLPPKQVNSKIPESLNNLILKAMDKNSNNRYQDAKELIVDLQKVKEDPNVIIGNEKVPPLDEGHTIVMQAVNEVEIAKAAESRKVTSPKDYEDEYNDDEYYYDDEYYDDDYKDEKKKKKKVIIIILSAIAILIAMFLITFAIFQSGKEVGPTNTIRVPEIVGMTLEQAKVALEREGLDLVEAGTEKSSKKEGTILEVDPNEGTIVESGAKIRVIVSSGADKVKMPDFKESDVMTVKTFLTKNGVTNIRTVDEYNNEIPNGIVIKTDPGVGVEVTQDTEVTIYVSKGKETKYVRVENYVGLSYEVAKTNLENAGLVVIRGEDKKTDDESQDGNVATQTNVNKNVEEGSSISLRVWKYIEPEKETIKVGEIGLTEGMSQDGAKRVIESKGLKAKIVRSGDLLKSWNPSGNSEVKKGDTITLEFENEKVDTNPNDTILNNSNSDDTSKPKN